MGPWLILDDSEISQFRRGDSDWRRLCESPASCMIPASYIIDALKSNEHHVGKCIKIIRLRTPEDIGEVQLLDNKVILAIPRHGKVKSARCLPQVRRKRDAVLQRELLSARPHLAAKEGVYDGYVESYQCCTSG